VYPLINRDNSGCFSGYRPEKLPWGFDEEDLRCKELKAKITEAAEQIHLSGIQHFICGMARGSDTYFCESMFFLRSKYSGITVEAAIPCETQSAGWREEDRIRYARLVDQCDQITYVGKEYTRNCMHRRNRYMVDNSSVILAVFDGRLGGTNYTLSYAGRRGLEIIKIAPCKA